MTLWQFFGHAVSAHDHGPFIMPVLEECLDYVSHVCGKVSLDTAVQNAHPVVSNIHNQ